MPEAVSMMGEAGSETTNITRESLAIHLYFSSDLVQRHLIAMAHCYSLRTIVFEQPLCHPRTKIPTRYSRADSRFMVSPENSRREVGLEGRVQPDTGECKKRHISLWSKPSRISRRSPLAHLTRSTKT